MRAVVADPEVPGGMHGTDVVGSTINNSIKLLMVAVTYVMRIGSPMINVSEWRWVKGVGVVKNGCCSRW